LYGFIPKLRHKLTYAIFGDYCVSNTNNIFSINPLFSMLFGLVGLLATQGTMIMLGIGILNYPGVSIALGLSGIMFGLFVGIAVGDIPLKRKSYDSVYRITDIE
jgi:membrane associated rhomboid family serine protease